MSGIWSRLFFCVSFSVVPKAKNKHACILELGNRPLMQSWSWGLQPAICIHGPAELAWRRPVGEPLWRRLWRCCGRSHGSQQMQRMLLLLWVTPEAESPVSPEWGAHDDLVPGPHGSEGMAVTLGGRQRNRQKRLLWVELCLLLVRRKKVWVLPATQMWSQEREEESAAWNER